MWLTINVPFEFLSTIFSLLTYSTTRYWQKISTTKGARSTWKLRVCKSESTFDAVCEYHWDLIERYSFYIYYVCMLPTHVRKLIVRRVKVGLFGKVWLRGEV